MQVSLFSIKYAMNSNKLRSVYHVQVSVDGRDFIITLRSKDSQYEAKNRISRAFFVNTGRDSTNEENEKILKYVAAHPGVIDSVRESLERVKKIQRRIMMRFSEVNLVFLDYEFSGGFVSILYESDGRQYTVVVPASDFHGKTMPAILNSITKKTGTDVGMYKFLGRETYESFFDIHGRIIRSDDYPVHLAMSNNEIVGEQTIERLNKVSNVIK